MMLRYKLVPQMKEYDRLGVVWVPYLMYFHKPNYVSNIVNTDSRGFRVTYKGEAPISDCLESNDRKCLLFGDSATFGIGATHDKYTIPSTLNTKSGHLWLNFGARAFGLTQSLLLFLFYRHRIKNIKNIVLLSGVSDLFLLYASKDYPKELGSFYSYSHYNKTMNRKPLSIKRKALKFFLEPYYGNKLDYSSMSAKDLAGRIFRGKGSESLMSERTNTESGSFQSAAEDARAELLYLFERNISTWKQLADMLGISLHYCLQPLANWLDRELSEEEKALFSELDALPDNSWSLLKEGFGADMHTWCRDSMKKICESNNVPFLDMNEEMSEKGLDRQWLFVDRVHLTDNGNRVIAEILNKEIED